MTQFNNEGLRALDATLTATNILSREYKKVIMTHAMHAVSQAYTKGYNAGEKDAGVHSFPLAVNPSAEAERLRAALLDLDPYSPVGSELSNRKDTP